jgi:hypothetical protein
VFKPDETMVVARRIGWGLIILGLLVAMFSVPAAALLVFPGIVVLAWRG